MMDNVKLSDKMFITGGVISVGTGLAIATLLLTHNYKGIIQDICGILLLIGMELIILSAYIYKIQNKKEVLMNEQ
ncbi:MAG: hypothetical protein ACP5L4_01885 [Thermoplasmata archaeon]